MQTLDVNAFLAKLFDTMPVWLPLVYAALKINMPGVTAQRKD
jgi:hypothetical protein